MTKGGAGFWIGAAVALGLAGLAAGTIQNEYFFFAGYIVLTSVVLATAWNILGGYAGYVNFGTAGVLRPGRLHRGGAVQVDRRAARGADRRRRSDERPARLRRRAA